MGRIGLTPNGLTLIGFAITTVGAILVGAQAWVIGGLVVFVGGVFDMFDGTLARATGQSSKFGAFMDSTFDKAGEILVFIGCIGALANSNVGTVPVLVASAAMGASIMVSYTRAKSDALGYSSGMGLAAVGIMPREVRLVIISLGIVLTGDEHRHLGSRVRPRRHPRRVGHHRHPADPSCPQPGQVGRHPVTTTTNGARRTT